MDVNRDHAIRALQSALEYQFRQPALLELALTHSSAGGRDNERLEFLGDSVLGYVVSEQLFQQFPHEDEGALTRLRARLVRGQTLSELASELKLGDCLVLGSGERKTGGRRRSSILADAMEAVWGAILIDGGLPAARHSILHAYGSLLADLPPAESLKDAKTRLQEFLQARGLTLPEYTLKKQSGPEHARRFSVSCTVIIPASTPAGVQQTIHATATDSSRRKAEQAVAEQILKQLDSEQHG